MEKTQIPEFAKMMEDQDDLGKSLIYSFAMWDCHQLEEMVTTKKFSGDVIDLAMILREAEKIRIRKEHEKKQLGPYEVFTIVDQLEGMREEGSEPVQFVTIRVRTDLHEDLLCSHLALYGMETDSLENIPIRSLTNFMDLLRWCEKYEYTSVHYEEGGKMVLTRVF